MNGSDIAPLAKKLAEENNVNWQHLPGTGPEGRVVERDVLEYLAKVMAGEEALDPTPEPLPDGLESWPEEEVATFSPGESDVDLEGFQAEVARASSDGTRDNAPAETADDAFDESAPFADTVPFDSAEETNLEDIAAVDAEFATGELAYDDDRIEVDVDEADAADAMMAAHEVELDPADEPTIREDIFLFDDDDTEPGFGAADESGFDADLSQSAMDDDSDNPWALPDEAIAENADDAAVPVAPVFTAEDNSVKASSTEISDREVDFLDDPFADEFAGQDELADDNELIITEDEDALIDDIETIDATPPEDIVVSEDDSEALIASEFQDTADDDDFDDGSFTVAEDEESAATADVDSVFAEAPEDVGAFDEPVVTDMDEADVTDAADSVEVEDHGDQLEPVESAFNTEDTADNLELNEEDAVSEGSDEWTSQPDEQLSEPDMADEITAAVAVASAGLAGASLSAQSLETEPSREQEDALEEADEAVAAFPPSSLPLVSYGLLLRRHLDLTALSEAQLAVGREFNEGTPVAPTAFLLRAAAKALKTVPLGDDHSLGLAIISRHGLGVKQLATGLTFAEVLEHLSEAQNSEDTTQDDTGLVVADMSAFDVDEAVLGLDAPVLTLGRILFDSTEGRYRTTLSLSGKVDAEAGATFLGRVAELLGSPVQLVI